MMEELTLFPSSLRCTSGHLHTKMQVLSCFFHANGLQEVHPVG